tara:strand:+ start:1941 stop:2564 length:624 start_codon:yes stop_codon:yes gene_type:complete
MLSLKALKKTFGSRLILKSVDLELKDGEVIAIKGPNGSGKTTLLRILATLMRSDSYTTAELDGFDISTSNEEVKARVGYLPHSSIFYPELSGFENLDFWAKMHNLDNRKQLVQDSLTSAGLADFSEDHTGLYSAGMLQRLGLAMATIHNPTTLLLDEPFNNLDTKGIEYLNSIIADSRKKNRSILMVTHQKDDLADKVLRLEKGALS